MTYLSLNAKKKITKRGFSVLNLQHIDLKSLFLVKEKPTFSAKILCPKYRCRERVGERSPILDKSPKGSPKNDIFQDSALKRGGAGDLNFPNVCFWP